MGSKQTKTPAQKQRMDNLHKDSANVLKEYQYKKGDKRSKASCNKQAQTQRYNHLISAAVQEKLRESLTGLDDPNSKKAYFESFIDTFLKDALKDPNGKCGQMLASSIFSPELLTKLDAQTNAAMARDIAFAKYRICSTLFKEQKEVAEDNTSKKIAIVCGRRQGKTTLNARLLIQKCLTPNSPCFYVHMTFANAIAQCYDECLKVAAIAGLITTTGTSRSDGKIVFSNGSTIQFRGTNNEAEQQKLRGFKQEIVIIDEAQAQRALKPLIDDVVEPLLKDYSDSQLIITGTPPRISGTYFELCWNDSNWKHYSWTMRNNVFIPNYENVLAEVCKEKGLTFDSPLIQREYMGKFVRDTEQQCYKDAKTYTGEIPQDFIPDEMYGGCDFGFSDFNGIVTIATNKAQKRSYVIYEDKFNKASISEIVTRIQKMMEYCKQFMMKRNPNYNLSRYTIYCDTNEQSISYELFNTYHINARNAYKSDKMMAIAQLAEELRTGRILTPKDGYIADEIAKTVYKRDPATDDILPELDDVFHPDIMDALLYASRQSFYDIGYDLGGEATTNWNTTNK